MRPRRQSEPARRTKLADAKLSDAATKLAQIAATITTLESQGKLGGADAATLSADTANALAGVIALIAGT